MKSSCLNYIYGVLRTLSFIVVAGLFTGLVYAVPDIDTGPFELEGNVGGGPSTNYTDTMDDPDVPGDDWSTYGYDHSLNCKPATTGIPQLGELQVMPPPPLLTCGRASGPGDPSHHGGLDLLGDGHDGGAATRHVFVWDAEHHDDQYTQGTKDWMEFVDRTVKYEPPPSDKTNFHHTEVAFYQNGSQQLFFKGALTAQNGSKTFGLSLHQDSVAVEVDGTRFVKLDGDGNPILDEDGDGNLIDPPELIPGDIFTSIKFTKGGDDIEIWIYVYVGEDSNLKTTEPFLGRVEQCVDLTTEAHQSVKDASDYCTYERNNLKTWAIVATLENAVCDGIQSGQLACANSNELATESADTKGYIAKDTGGDLPNLDAKGQEMDDLSHHPVYHNSTLDPLDDEDVFKIGFEDYPKYAIGEGGIDLTGFGLEGCFSSFILVSRASPSITAASEDMTNGQLGLCSIKVTKGGDSVSKIGDFVDYDITIENDGAINLYKESIIDEAVADILGTAYGENDPDDWGGLGDLFNKCLAMLAPTEKCEFSVSHKVAASDPDPMFNMVTALYNSDDQFLGDSVSDSDTHRVDLFDPGVSVVKTASPTIILDGDDVTYTYKITNTSTAKIKSLIPQLEVDLVDDGPADLRQGIKDDILGDLRGYAGEYNSSCDTLSTDEECSFSVVAKGVTDADDGTADDDKVVNRVDVAYNPKDFPNDIDAFNTATVRVFNPKLRIEKSAPLLTKVGDSDMGFDPVTYTFKLYNESFSKSLIAAEMPDLVLKSIKDDVLGDLTSYVPAACKELAETTKTMPCEFTVKVVYLKSGEDDNDPTTLNKVVASDKLGDPIKNTVTAVYNPKTLFTTTDVSDTADHTINLFVPKLTITKSCQEATFGDGAITVGEPAEWVYTVKNESWSNSLTLAQIPDLVKVSVEDDYDFAGTPTVLTSLFSKTSLAEGETDTAILKYTPDFDDLNAHIDPDTLLEVVGILNRVEAHYKPAGSFTNDIEAEDTHSCPILEPGPGLLVVEKVTIGGEGDYSWPTSNPGGLEPEEILMGLLPPTITRTTDVDNDVNPETPFFGDALPGSDDGFVTTHDSFAVATRFGVELAYHIAEDLTSPALPDGHMFISSSCLEEKDSEDKATIIPDGDGNGIPDTLGNGLTVKVGEDARVYCRWINEVQAKIIVDKITDPAGDSQAFAFELKGGVDNILQKFSLKDTDTPHDSLYLKPSTRPGGGTYTYSVEETVPTGWELDKVECKNQDGVLQPNPKAIHLEPAEVVTCKFYNNKIPLLTLVKKVDNKFSGDRGASDWYLVASGDGGIAGHGIADTFDISATFGPKEVKAGVGYALAEYTSSQMSENQFPFYEVKTDWNCTDIVYGSFDPDTDKVTLGYGDDVTCTIENKDILIEFCPEGTTSGRPELLTMSYDGISDGNDEETYRGGPDPQEFSGEVFVNPRDIDPAPDQVDIKIIPSPQGNVVWALDVDLNALFSFENGKNDAVAPKTAFEIYDSVGIDDNLTLEQRLTQGVHNDNTWVQDVGFHTSCSKALNVGQTYGLLTVEGGELSDGTPVGPTSP